MTDRIRIYIDSGDTALNRALKNKAEYIKNETLTTDFLDDPTDNLIMREISIGDNTFTIGLQKDGNQQGDNLNG